MTRLRASTAGMSPWGASTRPRPWLRCGRGSGRLPESAQPSGWTQGWAHSCHSDRGGACVSTHPAVSQSRSVSPAALTSPPLPPSSPRPAPPPAGHAAGGAALWQQQRADAHRVQAPAPPFLPALGAAGQPALPGAHPGVSAGLVGGGGAHSQWVPVSAWAGAVAHSACRMQPAGRLAVPPASAADLLALISTRLSS